MTKRWLKISLIILLTLLLTPGIAQAQNYNFSVPSLLMDVYVQPDASARIVYDITFENDGDPIDVVDIGTPNEDYNLDQITASIDGNTLTDIRPSTYIDVGVEIHLGEHAIGTGETGTLHVELEAPDLVFADTTNPDNASLQITPTWFDSSVVQGDSTIEVQVFTLPGIEPDEVLYQDEPFTDKYVDDQGRVVAVWRFENVSPTEPYRVGVSFPRQGLTNVVEITFWDLVGRWLSRVGGVLLFCVPFVIPALIIFFIVRGLIRAAKPHYLPPIAQVEGGGIKRGLTAPEAAVILELPLNKILGLVIFGMLEKRLIRETETDPLAVEVVEEFRVKDRNQLTDQASRNKYRREIARQKGTVIHKYEHAFLDEIEKKEEKPVKELDVVEPMEGLVNSVAEKMKGFDLSDTREYYERIVDRAVEQASSLGEVEAREAYLDKYLPWVMMRRDYRPVLTMGNYHYWPVWARQTRTIPTGGGGRSGGRSGGGRGGSTTTFGDVSASFAGWAETTMGTMAAAILPTSLTKPSDIVSSSGRSGGSSCACACAGCACACACAGGGR